MAFTVDDVGKLYLIQHFAETEAVKDISKSHKARASLEGLLALKHGQTVHAEEELARSEAAVAAFEKIDAETAAVFERVSGITGENSAARRVSEGIAAVAEKQAATLREFVHLNREAEQHLADGIAQITEVMQTSIACSESVIHSQERTDACRIPRSTFGEALTMLPTDLKKHNADLLRTFGKDVIAGFLNIGAAEGWPEGHDVRVGSAFVAHILNGYLEQISEEERGSCDYDCLERVARAFREPGRLFATNNSDATPNFNGNLPINSKSCYDSTVTSWQRHAVTRIVGNLGSEYNPLHPFFEVIINSQRQQAQSESGNPFRVYLFNDLFALDARRRELLFQQWKPQEEASRVFYSPELSTCGSFMQSTEERSDEIDRTLRALHFLENRELLTQVTGNCWMKQPLRGLLVSLYLELHALQKELSPEEAWEQALSLYLAIQTKSALPFVEELLESSEEISEEMKAIALERIAHRKERGEKREVAQASEAGPSTS